MKTNKTITIERLTTDPINTNIEAWTSLGTIDAMFLPLNSEMKQIAMAQGIIGKAYMLYADVSVDIQETDKIIVDDEAYEVRGIKTYFGSHAVDHLEVLIEKCKT